MSTSALSHCLVTKVPFIDTDASGLAHFTKILSYPENVEHSLFQKLRIPILEQNQCAWPRVAIQCDYKTPLRFGDEIQTSITLSKLGKTSLSWGFEISRDRTILAASGTMTCVKVNQDGVPTLLTARERDLFSKP